MTKTTSQIEKNVSASFGYVKKDLLMLNDAISDLHDQIHHLSMNHAVLLEEISRIRKYQNIKAPSKKKPSARADKKKTAKKKKTSKKKRK